MAKANTLIDDFTDDQGPGPWVPFGERREGNQRVELRPTGNPGEASGYESAVAYDLTSSVAAMELVMALRGTPSSGVYLQAIKDTLNRISLGVDGSTLVCQQQVAGTYTTLASVPYDMALHRWLRLREEGGTTFWETSDQGRAWTTLHSRANPFALTAVKLAFTAFSSVQTPPPGMAVIDSFNTTGTTSLSRRLEERRDGALALRQRAAALTAARPLEPHANVGDEVNYPGYSLIGNYSKGLLHDSVGDPDPVAYVSMLQALESRSSSDFERIQLGSGGRPLVNPQGGLAFELYGADTQEITMPPPARFANLRTAHEMGELYWMAAARDVHFADYGSSAIIANAVTSLNQEFPQYGGPVPVTSATVFRGIFPGAQVGPYVSQFLLKGNADPRKPDGLGRDADEGYITYGSQVIDQRQLTVAAGVNYLTGFNTWLNAQNGADYCGQDQFDTVRRFIRNLRDGAAFVHFDQVVNAFYNTAFLLLSEPTGTQGSGVGAGRPQVDMEFSLDHHHPYDAPMTFAQSRTQTGFVTFGPIHLLQALCEVAGRAGRAVWWQKWGVHRRLRPEEYGGRVDNHLKGRRTYPIDTSILGSLQTGGLSAYYPATGSYLLPQAYPEGAPLHPSYGSGHATISGACITILKAFFDDTRLIENPVIASANGLSLVAYTGAGATTMTVAGELNKLAHNISLFRNAAGVHWRADETESLLFGERIAIRLLQEMSLAFNESNAGFRIQRLTGDTIRIHDGVVDL